MLSPPPVPLRSSLPPYPFNLMFFFSVFKKHKQQTKNPKKSLHIKNQIQNIQT